MSLRNNTKSQNNLHVTNFCTVGVLSQASYGFNDSLEFVLKTINQCSLLVVRQFLIKRVSFMLIYGGTFKVSMGVHFVM